MTLVNLAGPLIFLVALASMFLIVTWKRIKELFWMGIIGGLALALILVLIMQNIYGFWVFYQVDLIYLFKIPFFLSAGWIPIIIIFSNYLLNTKNILLIAAIILSFSAGATGIHYLLIKNNMLTYNNWNLLLTYFQSLLIHIGITAYLYWSGWLGNYQECKIH